MGKGSRKRGRKQYGLPRFHGHRKETSPMGMHSRPRSYKNRPPCNNKTVKQQNFTPAVTKNEQDEKIQKVSYLYPSSVDPAQKRRLVPIEYVFAKENGFKKAYRYPKAWTVKDVNKDQTTGKIVKNRPRSTLQSIDDILSLSRPSATWEDDATIPRIIPKNTTMSSQDETLSGRSVQDVIKDRVGNRPRCNSTDRELNLPQRGLCDERTVLESYRWRIDQYNVMAERPKGLINLGNTCYLNSTLQCLAYIPPFCQFLLTTPCDTNGSKRSNSVSRNGGTKFQSQGRRITMTIKQLFLQVHSLAKGFSGISIAPRDMVDAVPLLTKIGNRGGYRFRPGRQEDSHEFLVHLLDAMHDGELQEAGINQHKSGWRDRLPVARLDETTFIHRTFGGYFRSQVRCTQCGYTRNTYDPFLDLSLEVSKKSCNTILDAIREFTKREKLDDKNKWKCSGCKKEVRATKQLTVFRPPLVLCIQLKRFAFSGGFPGFGFAGEKKISKPIDFPSLLNLPLSDGRSCQYHLNGTVVHLGRSATSGHYTACVKKIFPDGSERWFHADDSFVEPITEKAVMKHKHAYLLFYCRREVKIEYPSPPLRTLILAEEAKGLRCTTSEARIQGLHAEPSLNVVPVAGEMTTKGRGKSAERSSLGHEPSLEDGKEHKSHAKYTGLTTNGWVFNVIKKEDTKDWTGEKQHQHKGRSKETKMSNALSGTADHRDKEPASSSDESSSRSSATWDSCTSSTRIGGIDADSHDSLASKSNKNIGCSLDHMGKSKESTIGFHYSNLLSALETEKFGKLQRKCMESKQRTHSGTQSENERKSKSPQRGLSEEETLGECSSSQSGVILTSDSPSTASGKKMNKHNDARPQKTATTILVKHGKGDRSVSIMGQMRKGRIWTSERSPMARQVPKNDLLGNLSVEKWGEAEEEEVLDSRYAGMNYRRAAIVDAFAQRERSKKKRMFPDGWDALLDQGKSKKMKGKAKQAQSIEAQNVRFQKLQSRVQRMSRR